MSKKSDKTNTTVVKVFINTLACISMVSFSSPALAVDPGPSKPVKSPDLAPSTNPKPSPGTPSGSEAQIWASNEIANRCQKALETIKQSRNKIGEACRKAGIATSGKDASECAKKVESCSTEVSKDSYESMDIFAAAIGVQPEKVSNACPQLSGKDYFKEKDTIMKEIKDTEKELAELNDDKAEIQDKHNKEMQSLQEELTKAQEKLKERNLEIEQEDRERLAEFHNNQNRAKEELRKSGADMLKLRGKLIAKQREKALVLIAMTDASGKRACMKAVRDARKSYDSVSAGTSSNHIAQAKLKKTELINLYNDCMADFDQKRIALNETSKQEQDEINQEIANLQSTMDEIQNSLNLAGTQLEEMNKASEQKKSDALKAVVDLGNLTQQKIQAAYTKLQENLKTIAAKSASLQGALNRANLALANLGPAPKSRNSEYAPSDVTSEIYAENENIEDAKAYIRSQPECSGMLREDPTSSSKKRGAGATR